MTTQLDAPRAREAGVEVRLVSIELDAALDSPQLAVLDEHERQRAARFVRPADRVRSAATRAALREVLGERLAAPACSLRFAAEPSGRPRLAAPFEAALDFNVSHSGSHALIALSAMRRVGVDIETCRASLDWRAVGREVFSSDEAARAVRLDDAQGSRAFFATWTAKEALLKALGTGIAIDCGLPGFTVLGACHGPGASPEVRVGAAAGLAVAGLSLDAFEAVWCRVPAGYAACVAWSRGLCDSSGQCSPDGIPPRRD